MYFGVGLCDRVVLLAVNPKLKHRGGERKRSVGVPRLWKRVLVGTWVKNGVIEESYRDLYIWLDQRK